MMSLISSPVLRKRAMEEHEREGKEEEEATRKDSRTRRRTRADNARGVGGAGGGEEGARRASPWRGRLVRGHVCAATFIKDIVSLTESLPDAGVFKDKPNMSTTALTRSYQRMIKRPMGTNSVKNSCVSAKNAPTLQKKRGQRIR